VNKAPAKDLQDQLDLSGDEAAAIVKYRDANGGIKNWDDLAKVPGLDAKKLEPLKKRLKYA
jgi:competence ComEA-like helix-hairpin-helix protein